MFFRVYPNSLTFPPSSQVTRKNSTDLSTISGWPGDQGFSAAALFGVAQFRIANQLHPKEFSFYDTGYLFWVDIFSSIQLLVPFPGLKAHLNY
jgi:hypothetical protein